MLIVCPSCATGYEIQSAALGAGGRSVRCARCKTTWFASPDEPDMAVAAEPASTVIGAAEADTPPAPEAAPPEQIAEDFTGDFVVDGVVADAPNAPDGPADAPPTLMAETESPPLAPAMEQPAAASPEDNKFDPGTPDSIETLAARRERLAQTRRKRKKGIRALLNLPALIVTFIAILVGILYARVAIVRYIPQTASLYAAIGLPVNLRGIVFVDVKSTNEFHDGMMVLVVQGAVANITGHTVEVPRLRFAVRNSAGHEVYAWTALPARALIGPGDGLPFRTRLASPPPDGRDVIVRFFNRRDAVAGTK